MGLAPLRGKSLTLTRGWRWCSQGPAPPPAEGFQELLLSKLLPSKLHPAARFSAHESPVARGTCRLAAPTSPT